jgi:hydrogenase maturation protease
MNEKNIKTLILGIGNEILTDDGIGPRVVREISAMNLNSDVCFSSSCCGGMEIIENVKGYERVIFIDAIRTSDGKPGNVYHFSPSDFRLTSHLSNLHDIDFISALELGKTLDLHLPSDLHIIAIEIHEDSEFGEELSKPVREQYNNIIMGVLSIIKDIINQV